MSPAPFPSHRRVSAAILAPALSIGNIPHPAGCRKSDTSPTKPPLLQRNRRSGEHQCQSCLYIYDPKKGDPEYPVSAGVQFKALPEDWLCPTCGAAPKTFKNLGKEVAGFEQNQGYGLGTNSMSGGEKSVLIYGALAIFFTLFLGGYLLD